MADTTDEKKSYKKTLNLPKTGFSMKANLVQNEPASMKRWEQAGLYRKLREQAKAEGRELFAFHDGPPYANGSIHLGHLLNKVLKDFVVRSRTMLGHDVPYVPGWDCHGLPIEHKVMQELGEAAKSMDAIQIRRKCKAYAEKFVKLQSKQMQRLLTLADYGDPYLTMNPAYEAAVLEVFAGLIDHGLVYRGLKPVHWSIENQTALAEAELEYYDREDTSVYVLFEVEDAAPIEAACGLALNGKPVHLMIWTTTPWTLPANMAVAVHPRHEYTLVKVGDKYIIMAVELVEAVMRQGGVSEYEVVGTPTAGESITGVRYQHPFIDRTSPVVTADYVTLEDGTGLVHTAPGHGVEDYQTGLREGLDIYCPVRGDGTFDDTVPDWLQGKSIWDANDIVVQRLRDSGHLFHDHKFRHSYPHDWRGKTPVIFRATEQWFIGVDQPFTLDRLAGDAQRPAPLRERALDTTRSDVTFIPEWGRNRMRGMLESRPDWCISRQRSWGLPIPAFYPPEEPSGEGGEPLLTVASVRAVAKVIREKGSDAWFTMPVEDLLREYDPATDPDAPAWISNSKEPFESRKPRLAKSTDIFDVWFESGSSWHAVLDERHLGHSDGPPADLYLEGSDQHRGWFQASLLPSLGVTGHPPFKTVLTHGFMVDKDGHKMSKSLGNTLEVDELFKNFGADVCRWWVSSLNADNDIKVDESFFRIAGEEYRKVRNTIRFLLSNLGDFDITTQQYQFADSDAVSLDAWALRQLDMLIEQVTQAYQKYQFRRASELLFNFCNDTMSAVYLTAVKDRLYCDRSDSPRRRRTQTALHRIADGLIRLLAPILPHTADEAWAALYGDHAEPVSVHLATLPEKVGVPVHPGWYGVIAYRDALLKALEEYRQSQKVDNPLDLGLRASRPVETVTPENFDPIDLADLCGVSRFELLADGRGIEVIDLRDQPRCERSWKRDGTVKQRSDGGWLSDRDAEALGLA